jgi:Delta7-sterol 5-desaturase
MLNEYLSGCAVTLIFALALYFLLSGLSYLALYVWGKRKFTPRE